MHHHQKHQRGRRHIQRRTQAQNNNHRIGHQIARHRYQPHHKRNRQNSEAEGQLHPERGQNQIKVHGGNGRINQRNLHLRDKHTLEAALEIDDAPHQLRLEGRHPAAFHPGV